LSRIPDSTVLEWGKIVAIDANEDSQAVAKWLKPQGRYGLEEASVPPMLS
jgi:hypothetical protein